MFRNPTLVLLYAEQVTVVDNTAATGAGMLAKGICVDVSDSTFTGNYGSVEAGGLGIQDSRVCTNTIKRTSWRGNSAGNGGAVVAVTVQSLAVSQVSTITIR